MIIDYAKLVPCTRSSEKLTEFLIKNGMIDLNDKPDFHLTVVYSRLSNPAFVDTVQGIVPIAALPKHFSWFGPENKCLVLEVRSASLVDLHDSYRRKYGHIADYEPYRPHITIKNPKITQGDILATPEFPIIFDRLVHEKRQVNG